MATAMSSLATRTDTETLGVPTGGTRAQVKAAFVSPALPDTAARGERVEEALRTAESFVMRQHAEEAV